METNQFISIYLKDKIQPILNFPYNFIHIKDEFRIVLRDKHKPQDRIQIFIKMNLLGQNYIYLPFEDVSANLHTKLNVSQYSFIEQLIQYICYKAIIPFQYTLTKNYFMYGNRNNMHLEENTLLPNLMIVRKYLFGYNYDQQMIFYNVDSLLRDIGQSDISPVVILNEQSNITISLTFYPGLRPTIKKICEELIQNNPDEIVPHNQYYKIKDKLTKISLETHFGEDR